MEDLDTGGAFDLGGDSGVRILYRPPSSQEQMDVTLARLAWMIGRLEPGQTLELQRTVGFDGRPVLEATIRR